jgi:uncharacterized protein
MRVRRLGVQAIAISLFIPAASLPAARRIARAHLFPPSASQHEAVGEDVVTDTVFARDGMPVRALELHASGATRTIAYFHNNRETADGLVDFGRGLRKLGFDVVLVEYRGYGASPGRGPCEEGLYADAEAVLDMLAKRGVANESIVLWGTSLGTGVAAEMARRGHGVRLVLVSPYTSIPALVTDVVPFLPARLLVPDHFDTASKAPAIGIQTLIVHGDRDEIVPVWMGQELSREFPVATLIRVAGGHHGDLMLPGESGVLGEIASFLR